MLFKLTFITNNPLLHGVLLLVNPFDSIDCSNSLAPLRRIEDQKIVQSPFMGEIRKIERGGKKSGEIKFKSLMLVGNCKKVIAGGLLKRRWGEA